jgi:thioredoxin 1
MSKFQDIVQTKGLVLIDFYADWCGPCQMMSPVLESVKKEVQDALTILKINVDKNPKMASLYQVRGVPTFVLFQEGKLVWRQSGMMSKRDFIDLIHRYKKNP